VIGIRQVSRFEFNCPAFGQDREFGHKPLYRDE
jgi:hypothetical protein